MKIKNLFKKSEVKATKVAVTKMDKTQLSKVVGGTGGNGNKGHIVGQGGNGLV